MLTLLALNRGKYEIVQIKVMPESEASNHFIKDLSMPEESLILALTRKEDMLIPKGNTRVLAGDELLILMTGEKRRKIQNIFDVSV
jgi:trk system potassium uptake protein TrkA